MKCRLLHTEPASGCVVDVARALKDEADRVAKVVAAAGIKPP